MNSKDFSSKLCTQFQIVNAKHSNTRAFYDTDFGKTPFTTLGSEKTFQIDECFL